MKQLTRDEAIQEYGVHYTQSLEDVDLSIPTSARTAEEELAFDLNRWTPNSIQRTVKIVEELGPASQPFHFSSVDDAKKIIEAAKRQDYRQSAQELANIIAKPDNKRLIDNALTSEQQADKVLTRAFQSAVKAMLRMEEIAASKIAFDTEVQELNTTVTLPDHIAKLGDILYIVENDGVSTPAISSGEVIDCDMYWSLFSQVDYSVQYKIQAITPFPSREEGDNNEYDSFVARDTNGGSPQNVVAQGKNSLVFNTKAAAMSYLDETLDQREKELTDRLQSIRDYRSKLRLK